MRPIVLTLLQDEFPGLENRPVGLIEGEMSRLHMFYEGHTVDWPIFNLACCNIFLNGDEERKDFNRRRTLLWTRFAEKGLTADNFLPEVRWMSYLSTIILVYLMLTSQRPWTA